MRVWFEARRLVPIAQDGTAWLGGISWRKGEREQLDSVLAEFGDIDLDEAVGGDRAFFDAHADQLAHAPMEWWDVVNTDFQLVAAAWFYGSDCGTLFRGCTTESIGKFIQWRLHDAGPEDVLGPIRTAVQEQYYDCPGVEWRDLLLSRYQF